VRCARARRWAAPVGPSAGARCRLFPECRGSGVEYRACGSAHELRETRYFRAPRSRPTHAPENCIRRPAGATPPTRATDAASEISSKRSDSLSPPRSACRRASNMSTQRGAVVSSVIFRIYINYTNVKILSRIDVLARQLDHILPPAGQLGLSDTRGKRGVMKSPAGDWSPVLLPEFAMLGHLLVLSEEYGLAVSARCDPFPPLGGHHDRLLGSSIGTCGRIPQA